MGFAIFYLNIHKIIKFYSFSKLRFISSSLPFMGIERSKGYVAVATIITICHIPNSLKNLSISSPSSCIKRLQFIYSLTLLSSSKAHISQNFISCFNRTFLSSFIQDFNPRKLFHISHICLSTCFIHSKDLFKFLTIVWSRLKNLISY